MQKKLSVLSSRASGSRRDYRNWSWAWGSSDPCTPLFPLWTILYHILLCIFPDIYYWSVYRYDVCHTSKQKDFGYEERLQCDYDGIKLIHVHRLMKWYETLLLFLWHLLFYTFSVVIFILLVTPIVYYTYIYIANEWWRVSDMFLWQYTFRDYMLQK